MTKAIAIAAVRESSLVQAVNSAKNLFAKLIDLMYGSNDRVRITYSLALALLLLGYSMQTGGGSFYCAVN